MLRYCFNIFNHSYYENTEVGIIIPAETESAWKALCGCALDTDHPWCQSDKAAWKHWEVGFWDSLFWDKHESPAFSTHPNTTAMRATARNFLGQGTSARPWDRLHPPPRCSLSNVPPFESLPAAKVWRPLETHLNSQVWDMARRLITFQSFHHNPSPNARCHCWTSGRQ